VLSDPDVLVVGLGPAGACAAAAAARAGARVLAVERRRRIGWPVQCAELVPRALASDASRRAAVQEVNGLESVVENDEVEVRADRGRIIDRARFDALLAGDARAAGATVHTGIAVAEVAADGHVRLSDGTSLQPRAIVGADGPRSLVGRAIAQPNRALVRARQIRVRLRAPLESARVFLAARYPGSYGWLFPRGREANVGCGVAIEAHRALGRLLADLAVALARASIVEPEPIGRTGGTIPVGGIVGPTGWLGRVPVLLAGDAAGLANPVTGAGIAAAVLSGTLAGEAAAAAVSGHPGALPAYAEELRDLFAGSFKRALVRRRATWQDTPSPAALRQGWPGFAAYWQVDGLPV
jgi:digeranylgeranylglycerophospholipid reductase